MSLGINLSANLLSLAILPHLTTHPDGRWAGITGSANYLGALSFCCVWASFAWLTHTKVGGKTVALSCLAVAIAVLIGSKSVTSLVCSFVVVMFYTIKIGAKLSTSKIDLALLLCSFALMILFFILIVDVDSLLAAVGRDRSASGRTEIWSAAIKLTSLNPWFGYGFGSNTESLGVLHWATSFHNGYLDVAVKLGFTGLFLFLLILLKTFFSVVWLMKKKIPDSFDLGVFVLAYLVYNISENSILTSRFPTWILFSAVVVIVLYNYKTKV